jgi:predicted PurR-regulated permease PerM
VSTAAVVAPRRFRIAPVLTAIVLTVLLIWLFGKVADVLLLLFVAILISLGLGALSDFFTRRLRLPRPVAFLLAVLATLGGVGGLLALLVPPVVQQTKQLITVLPTYIAAWEAGMDRLVARTPALQGVWQPGTHRVLTAVYDQVAGTVGDIVPKVFSVAHALIDVFSVVVMSIYLALHPGLYREWLIALFPPVHRDLVRDVLGDLADTLRSYIVGQLFTMSVLALLTAIGLSLLHVPYWLTFGVFTGMVAVVPFFGTLLSTLLPALFVLGGDGLWGLGPGTHALLVILLGVVIHLIEGNVVSPLVMSRKVELPPVLTIMSVLVMGKLLGGVGLLVAVPTLAMVRVVVMRILISRIYEGQGFRRTTRDRALVLRVPVPEGTVIVPEGAAVDVVGLAEREAARRNGEREPGMREPAPVG